MLSACKSEGAREGKRRKRREKKGKREREKKRELHFPQSITSLISQPAMYRHVWETEVPTVRRHGKQAKEPGFLHQELHLLLFTLQHKN